MTNWTEVNVYTGRPVDEDAPTNFGGAGSGVDMNPTGMKKKKKRLEDARTKSYKTHRAKLETARVKREAKRNSVKEGTLNEKSAKYLELEFKDKQTAINAYRHINNKIAAGGSQPWKDFNQEGNSLQFDKMDDADGLMKELKKKFKFKVYEREEVELDEAILKEIKKASLKFSLGMNSDMMKAKKDLEKKGHKVKVSGNKMTVTAKSGSDIDRELSDIRNFYDRGVKIKAENYESVEKTFSQKVKESVSNFNVESLLAEDNVDVLRSIVKRKSAKPIKFKDGTMTIDMQTANMMLTVLDKVKPANQKKLAAMMNGKKSEFMKVHGFVMKALGK